MDYAIWIAKKNHLCSLIKKISDYYGGDELGWLKEYAKEIVETHKMNIDKALDCFLLLDEQLIFMKSIKKR